MSVIGVTNLKLPDRYSGPSSNSAARRAGTLGTLRHVDNSRTVVCSTCCWARFKSRGEVSSASWQEHHGTGKSWKRRPGFFDEVGDRSLSATGSTPRRAAGRTQVVINVNWHARTQREPAAMGVLTNVEKKEPGPHEQRDKSKGLAWTSPAAHG